MAIRTATLSELYNYDTFPAVKRQGKIHRKAYGRYLPGNPNDVEIELWAAAQRLTPEQGGLGEFEHYKRAMGMLYPHLVKEWHHWLDGMLESMVGESSTDTWLGGGGIGKAQSLNDTIRTPDGWVRMGDIQVGDSVCTPDGRTARVIQLHPQGIIPLYKVSFSDGTSTLCSEDHLWLTTTNEDRKARNKHRARSKGSVKTTKEIAETLSCKTTRFAANHYIPVTQPVFGEDVDLLVDPYTLGAIIANGSPRVNDCTITINKNDTDILNRILELDPSRVSVYENESKTGSVTFNLKRVGSKLKKLNLTGKRSWEKHIPQEYLHASVDRRLALFQGLNDGDGTPWAAGRGVEYSTTSEQLCYDYLELAQSLGCLGSISVKEAPTFSYKGEERVGRKAYRVFVRVPGDLQPFFSGRKLKKLQKQNRTKISKAIVSVEYFDDLEAQCITIDSKDQLYITNDYIVTHNSWWSGTFARVWYAAAPLKRGVMIINTTQKSQTDRAWGYTIQADLNFPWLAGEQIGNKTNPKIGYLKQNSRGKLEAVPQIGIISQTVKRGSSATATADLKGLHPEELIVIVEESNHLIKAHLERARGNWIRNRWYKILFLGNPEIEDTADVESADALYFFSTPKRGWSYINWGEDRSWENVFGGRTYHFDILDSPAIVEPEKYVESYWLPNEDLVRKIADEMGGENSALFKQQGRGMYDHDSLPFNPITYGMCEQFRVKDSALFTGFGRQRWASFDPAFTGNDEAFLKIAESGLTESGVQAIDFMGEKTNFTFRLDGNSADEPSFQMLKWVQEKLREWEVPPENFIMDANIIGIALGDIFTRYLSPKINKIKISGKPSKEFVDLGQTHTAADLYFNRATELWMGLQKLMVGQQIKGLDDSIINQLVMMSAERINDKTKIMEKKKFRAKFGYSPDRAEACIFLAWMVRERGLKQAHGDTGNEGIVRSNLLESPWLQGQSFRSEQNGLLVNAAGTPFGEEPEEEGVGWQDFLDTSFGGWD